METNLDTLIELTAKRFPADEVNHPSLIGKSEEERLVFNIRHQLLHMTKRVGKIATLLEDYEHGGKKVDVAAFKEQIPKAVIDILRIAQILGMTGNEITKAIEKK